MGLVRGFPMEAGMAGGRVIKTLHPLFHRNFLGIGKIVDFERISLEFGIGGI